MGVGAGGMVGVGGETPWPYGRLADSPSVGFRVVGFRFGGFRFGGFGRRYLLDWFGWGGIFDSSNPLS